MILMDTIIQWNCRGLSSNWEELRFLISQYSPACICLQETMVGDGTPSGPPGYHSFYSDPLPGQGRHGGAAILLRQDVPYNKIDINTDLQAVAVQIFLRRQYTICSIYLPPSAIVERNDVNSLAHDLPSPFLLLGDMNGHHPLWGDNATDNRGTILATVVEDLDLCILNSGDMTYYHGQTGVFTAIDLSLCSADAVLDFNWSVLPDLHGSDHFPILISSTECEPRRRLPRWRLDRANWPLFAELCSPDCSVDSFASTEDAATYVTDMLHSAALQAIPKTAGHFPHRPLPWWNAECTSAIRAKRIAFSRLRRHRGEAEYLIAFRRARANARRVLKDARRTSWRAYVSSINSKTPLTQVWNRVRKISGKYAVPSPPVLLNEGMKVADSHAVAELFVDHFARISKKDTSSPSARLRRNMETSNISFASSGGESYNVPFSVTEFNSALSKCQDSSPGYDDIPYAFIRHMSIESLTFLLALYNRIWCSGEFPASWGVAVVLPIPKPGKDHLLATNYRPISLTSCLCKVLEKMVNGRLMWYLEKGNHLSPGQYGFRQMRSTSDALLSLESSICEAFATNQHQVTVFFDLEKAYDTTWRHGILQSLYDFGLRGHLPIFIQQFLSNRFLRVRVGNEISTARPLEDGVPQGSILSVTLFAIAINSVIAVLPDGVRGSLYVDDLSISVMASRMTLAERKLQLAINRVTQWADARGFRFSPAKTVAMHFCRIRGVHPDPDLYLYGRRLSCVEETRFLGLIYDSRLTWVPHLRHVKMACMRALSLLRVLSHTSWGADRQTLLLLHRTLILSKLEYGSEIYSSATEARLRVLDSVHHAGVRLATGAFCTSPIPSLLVDAGVFPLALRRQSSLLRCWCRLHRLPESASCVCVSEDSRSHLYVSRPSFPKPFGFRAASAMETFNLPLSVCPHRLPRFSYWQFPPLPVCSPVISNRNWLLDSESHALFLEHYTTHTDSIPVFTDGSKSGAGVGYAVVFPSFCRGGCLPDNASVFTAEMSAIILAFKLIFTLPISSFTIFSDSRSALSALQHFGPSSPHPLVLSALEWFYLLHRRGYSVRFCWVPAHVGVLGNERADRLAKEASTRAAPSNPVPFRDLYPSIRVAVLASWQRQWESLVGTTKMGEVTSTTYHPWTYIHVRERHTETALARLRVGHSRLTHGYLMSRGPQPFCEDCLVPLTVRHILVECPSLVELRKQYLFNCRGAHGTYEMSLILGERALSPGHEVLLFVEEAGFLTKL